MTASDWLLGIHLVPFSKEVLKIIKKLLLLLSLILLIIGLSASVSKASVIFAESITHNLTSDNTLPLVSWFDIELPSGFATLGSKIYGPMIDTIDEQTQIGPFEKTFIIRGSVEYYYKYSRMG